MKSLRHSVLVPLLSGLVLTAGLASRAADDLGASPVTWPALTQTARPWAYWWWMASAVDANNLRKELTRYRDAGMGGVHIIPIYGAKGWESNTIPYLNSRWMEMLAFTVGEAQRLGLGVDMTTGSGWCFGGPKVTDADANASVVWKTYQLGVGERITERLDRRNIQAVVAFGPGGKAIDLAGSLSADGEVNFSPPGNWVAVPGKQSAPPKTWTIYAVSQKPSGQKVKRAAPGGEGWMLNLASPAAMTNYLRWFDEAFAHYTGPKPRAQYHDSYEYRTDWSLDFFAEFERRRGYRLQDELPALFANAQPPRARGERDTPLAAGPPVNPDRIARVKCDYRETISDLMAEMTLPQWAKWSHDHGFITRNEAHGSPGNWLDLYAAADIPETEMFYKDRNRLISKFASSAAHVTGKTLVSSETGTWLAEHFTETLADMKYLLDDLFLSGVNHVFYHGTCYSPDEAPWPGWLFYASYEMNPRNPIWHDASALNTYAARCQAVLQAGQPDNDVLLYWPIHDFWSTTNGLARNMTVHARDWFEEQPVGKTAEWLWKRGYQFDYVSDRQLAKVKVEGGWLQLGGAEFLTVVVPKCEVMPLATFSNLLALVEQGGRVVFEQGLPTSAAGLGGLGKDREAFARLRSRVRLVGPGPGKLFAAMIADGSIYSGDLTQGLGLCGVVREEMFDRAGLMCIRRRDAGGLTYFVANRSPDTAVEGWVPLARGPRAVAVMDPMGGESGAADVRRKDMQSEVFLKLAAGESVLLRAPNRPPPVRLPWLIQDRSAATQHCTLTGEWQVRFLSGGPELPAPFATTNLASWTTLGDTNAQRLGGTALYTLRFDSPGPQWVSGPSLLHLGKVAQSARVRLNGQDLGSLFTPPFTTFAGRLKPTGNLLEVQVTSTAANRIRDLDRRGVNWKNFHDINFVNLDYKPFDASKWPLADCGLLGPVTISPAVHRQRGAE